MKQVALTKEQIDAISKEENSTVYTHEYDYHEPLRNDCVKEKVHMIIRMTKRLKDKEKVLEQVDKVGNLREFKKNHPTLVDKLSDIHIVSNREHMRVVNFMIETQLKVQKNSISEQQGASEVAAYALTNLAVQGRTQIKSIQ